MYRITYDPQFVPEQSLYINVKTMLVKGEPAYIMKNHLTGAYYTLGDLAYQVWNLIDGKRTMAQIAEEMKSVGNVLAVLAAKRSLLFFAEHNCLQSTVELPKEKRVRAISAFEIRVNILNRSKNALESIHRVVHPLLRRPLLWISLAFIVACALVFSGRFVTIFRTKEFFAIPIGEQSSSVVGFFFYFFAVLLPIITVHEIAHGLALVHYGGAPKEIGTGLFYFGPMFYINTTDAWMLPRRQRIMVFLAGPLSTLLIGSALVVLTFLGPVPAGFIDRVPIMTAFFCFYLTLSNLAPPFETDGYYVLMDLVNNPYLRQEAYRYVKTLFLRLLRKSVEEESESFTGKKRVLLAYFTLSVGWIIYLIYQSLQVLVYMTEDVVDAVFNMGSVIFLNQAITLATTTVAIASIAYFGMTVAGYGVMVVAAVRKVFVKTLPFQAIHDRDLSVFLHLPTQASKFLVNALKDRMRKVARKFTLNYDIESMGTQCSAVLHIGGTRLALVQIREYLGKVEEAFYSMYRDFLHDHEIELFKSVGIRHSQEKNLTALLEQVGDELASSGRPEAKAIVNQII
ncbi:MAG: PqqD family peptide modification chaperone, partial [Candidatus Bathyarchaeota archaeon]